MEQTFPKTQYMLQKNTGEGVRQAQGRSGADLSKDTRHATEKHREVRQVQCRSKADLSKKTRHATEKDASETGAMQK